MKWLSQIIWTRTKPKTFLLEETNMFPLWNSWSHSQKLSTSFICSLYEQSWKNVPNGKSSKRNSSRSRSSNGDWNAIKAKNQVSNQKFKYVKKPDSRDVSAKSKSVKPRSVKPKSSHGPSSSSHLPNKPKSKGNSVAKASVVAPICKKILKPIYRWVPKKPASNSLKVL